MYSFKEITKSETRNMSFLKPVITEAQNLGYFHNRNNKQSLSQFNSNHNINLSYRHLSTKDLFDSKNNNGYMINRVRTPTENFSILKTTSPKSPIYLPQKKYFMSNLNYQKSKTDTKKNDAPQRIAKQNITKSSKNIQQKIQYLRFSGKSEISLKDTYPSKKSPVLKIFDSNQHQINRIYKKQSVNSKIEQILIEQKIKKKQQFFLKKTSLDLIEVQVNSPSTLTSPNQKIYSQTQNISKMSNPKQSASSTNKLSNSDFIYIKLMGKGKFGDVHMVKHKETGFIAALKTIKKKQIIQEKLVGQFIREIKIHSYLNHPNIVDFYGTFEDKQHIYILLQLGSQGQLYTKLKQKEKYSEQGTAFIIRNLLSAVSYMHSKKLLHRDIKPENIVISHGIVKLCDFGWAIYRGNDLRKTFCGTPLYVSPEILTGQSYDEKTDLWTIGILAYELVVGNTPFSISQQQEMKKIVTDQIKFPKDINISQECKDFILNMLKKNPKERLTCEQLLKHPFMQIYHQFQTCQQLCSHK